MRRSLILLSSISLTLCLCSRYSTAQPLPENSVSSPRATAEAFGGVVGVYKTGTSSFTLFEQSSGGNACPSMYEILFSSGNKNIVSEPFGTCSDIPKISVSGADLVVEMPDLNDRNNTRYVDNNGVVTQSTIPPVMTGSLVIPNNNYAAATSGKSVYDIFSQTAVADAIHKLVDDSIYQVISTFQVGSDILITPDHKYSYGSNIEAHMGLDESAFYVFSNDGHIWIKVHDQGLTLLYGDTKRPKEVQDLFEKMDH
jgi:hypothetical protein